MGASRALFVQLDKRGSIAAGTPRSAPRKFPESGSYRALVPSRDLDAPASGRSPPSSFATLCSLVSGPFSHTKVGGVPSWD